MTDQDGVPTDMTVRDAVRAAWNPALARSTLGRVVTAWTSSAVAVVAGTALFGVGVAGDRGSRGEALLTRR